MTDWDFLLTPLLVLPIVLLFRFVGCGLTLTGEIQPTPAQPAEPSKPSLPPPSNPTPTPPVVPPPEYPKYRDHILGLTSVIAYWRLVDTPSAGGVVAPVAADEKGLRPGTYQVGYPLPPTADSKGIAKAAITPVPTSLIVTDTTVAGHHFDGGHVRVDFPAVQPDPYTDEFTIEAWVQATAFDLGYEYVLFDARARYTIPGMGLATRGFRVFVDTQNYLGVQLAPSNTPNLFPAKAFVPLGAPTHVALTVKGPAGGPREVSLYIGGNEVTNAPVNVNAYNRPDKSLPLLIGVENLEDNPAQNPQYRHPVLCRIQEVVLHDTALSKLEIKKHVDINKL